MMNFSFSRKRYLAWALIIVMVAPLFTPYQAHALTGGPSQPEVQSFEPIGTSEMVDVSSGSFTYNIPLLEVGGYPLNLAYHAGITPDDEASVCGLGWNINPGVVNRNMRGLPDDFSGDVVEKEFNMKPNRTFGGSLAGKVEVYGLGKKKKDKFGLSANMGVFYNNYKGVGFEFGVSPGFTAGSKGNLTTSFGLGLQANSQQGVTLTPLIGFDNEQKKKGESSEKGSLFGGLNIGASVNSREGLTNVSVSPKINGEKIKLGQRAQKLLARSQNSIQRAKELGLLSGTFSFDFALPSYSPSATLPFMNLSYTGSSTIGGEITGLHLGGTIQGYFSQQSLMKHSSKNEAYGFLYAQNGAGSSKALMDFNREKDGPFTPKTKHLPPVVFTNDVYGVSGQGIAGSYQLKRGDLGLLSDPKVVNLAAGAKAGAEVGFGAPPGVHLGADIKISITDSRSGRWEKNNDAAPKLDFIQSNAHINDPAYEPAYFKIGGEMAVETDPNFLKNVGGVEPVRVNIESGIIEGMNVKATDELVTTSNKPIPIKQNRRNLRERRNQAIAYLTAGEAQHFGLETHILNYPINNFTTSPQQLLRTGGTTPNDFDRPKHHLSEISVLRNDGLRYFYGIPAYNIKQQEVSFSVSGSNAVCSTGLVNYTPGGDDSKNNTNGEENYYNKVSMPAYAHSYLLTAIVSPDYVDITGNGPSPDDHGTYTKFNYHRVRSNYAWRVPYYNVNTTGSAVANFNEGFKSDPEDDKANYVAGEKEYWVLHSVESKTEVAEFYYNETVRTDALDAQGQKLPRLDRITLFSRPDRLANGNSATPIKSVFFEYDQSLCAGGLPNSASATGGKLTLKKLWFTNGISQKGKLSPYKFEYGDHWSGKINPEYNLKSYNRWGTYQPNPITGTGNGCYTNPASTTLSNSDYPYVEQDSAKANKNAAAWNLTKITLPSGGEIKVEYESHHYAFTQDRRAMEMIEVAGAGDRNGTYPGTNRLYESIFSAPTKWFDTGNNRIYFNLREKVSNKEEFYEKYLRGAFGDKSIKDGYLYFRFLVRINSANSASPAKYEFVPGYIKIDLEYGGYGVGEATVGNISQPYAWIDLQKVNVRDFNFPPKMPQITIPDPYYVNPIAKLSWQFTRLYLPEVAFSNHQIPEPNNFGQKVIAELANTVSQMKQFAVGFNNSMHQDKYCQEFVPGKSWMRLCSPDGDKLAGGSRVKSIRIRDNWDKMDAANGQWAEYGQVYDYTMEERGQTISSGVAAYEPALGGDENPFKQPQFYSANPVMAPTTEYVQEEPFGEAYFPAPQIVYSRVTVRNLPHKDVTRTATGAVVHEFYTARDFPTLTKNTGAKAIQKKTKGIFKQLLLKHKDFMTATEGFLIELNDMHGKPKKQSVYDESGTKISGVEYRYKSRGKRLVNEYIPVVNNNGALTTATVGLEFAMFTDSREMRSKTRDVGMELNNDNYVVGLPIFTFFPWPAIHMEETRFRSMVTMKVVQRYGILEETIAYDLGASVSTKNLAFDAETGQPILTETANEFRDPIFNLNLPAHWAYEGMRGAYQNLGAEFMNVTVQNGIHNAPLPQFYFPGDEIIQIGISNPQRFWVKDVDLNTGNVYFIDAFGHPLSYSPGRIKIVRSGARNQQTASIGSVTSLRKPFNTSGGLDFQNKEIINASAIEFSDRWQTWCMSKFNDLAPCKCKNNALTNDLLTFLNTQYPNGQFEMHPRSAPILWPANLFNPMVPKVDNQCKITGSAISYWMATELAGNDLVIYFGKRESDLAICWMPCFSIPGFDILVNPTFGPAPTLPPNSFFDLKPNLSFCDGQSFCMSGKVKSYFNQNGTGVTRTPFDAVFNFCGHSSCLPLLDCQTPVPLQLCGSEIVNPYRTDNRGVFRPLRSWTYLTERKQNTSGANIREDGAFEAFNSFWNLPNVFPRVGSVVWVPKPTGWTWASEVTRYNPVGNELENRDPLNRYSAELSGYAHTQVVAMANNARYRQIASDGFEDYFYEQKNGLNPCYRRHFGFNLSLVQADSCHSGKYALQLPKGTATSSKDTVLTLNCPAPLGPKPANQPFKLDECDCVGVFSPSPGKYIFSAWVRESRSPLALKFDKASVTITAGTSAQTLKADGPIIEGWQRIYGEFDIPASAKNIEIKLNAAPDVTTRFDDIRIHPFDASFKAFVYDDISLRFTYELDGNNFFTKYEYDQQGALERIKKETERGVMTIQESRFGQQKQ